ncbi:MAG: phosphate ABC transporter permease subunit PstC [Defluviitaleaceae bacterium]|nr:phosphate ABC transporter permease subunit PstC [Defluviitaleaceae bacterium]
MGKRALIAVTAFSAIVWIILFWIVPLPVIILTVIAWIVLLIFNKELGAKILFIASASAAVIAVGLICVFLFAQGIPAMLDIGVLNFLTGTDWRPTWNPPLYGILPMIAGSLYVTAGAILFGVPVGIFAAVFMAKFCPRRIHKVLKPAINLLAGIPSVVYGYFGMVVLVPFVRENFGGNGNSILTASMLLGMMILPTIITISEHAIRAVPPEIYDGAVALGASHESATFKAVLPAAKSGVTASVILGIGRAVGETMAVRMVAGNQAVMRMPHEFLSGTRTLTSNVVIELGYAYGDHRAALIATGVVLFAFILLINTMFMRIRGRK